MKPIRGSKLGTNYDKEELGNEFIRKSKGIEGSRSAGSDQSRGNTSEEYRKEKVEKQMSIGQELNLMSKMKEIDYQNSLVMTSLEQYNEKYEILKKEQTELLESANQKIEELKTSNEMIKEVLSQELASLTLSMQQETKNLIKKSEKEISTLSDNFGKILSTLNTKIEDTYTKHTERITDVTTETVQKCEDIQNNAKKRFRSYFERRKIIDWLVYINLGITPIFLILLFFVKK